MVSPWDAHSVTTFGPWWGWHVARSDRRRGDRYDLKQIERDFHGHESVAGLAAGTYRAQRFAGSLHRYAGRYYLTNSDVAAELALLDVRGARELRGVYVVRACAASLAAPVGAVASQVSIRTIESPPATWSHRAADVALCRHLAPARTADQTGFYFLRSLDGET